MIIRQILSYVLGTVILISVLSAQSGNGVINGTITDASGGVIPGARLILTAQETNISRETVSSSVGNFFFGEVPPGPYKLLVEQTGFKKWEGALTLEVGQRVEVNPKLEVGSLADTIEVTGVTPVITTEGMQVSDVKDELRIRQLPLN